MPSKKQRETEVVIGKLKNNTLGYTKGATVITCNGREPGHGIKWLFGLIKDDGDEHWGNFVASEGLQIENTQPFYDIVTSDCLSTLSLLTMKGLLKLPSNYFD
ncbi:MAG: hypothetical protein V4506_14450 [Bacteroidota bacterium]